MRSGSGPRWRPRSWPGGPAMAGLIRDAYVEARIHRASNEYRAMYYKAHNALEAIRKREAAEAKEARKADRADSRRSDDGPAPAGRAGRTAPAPVAAPAASDPPAAPSASRPVASACVVEVEAEPKPHGWQARGAAAGARGPIPRRTQPCDGNSWGYCGCGNVDNPPCPCRRWRRAGPHPAFGHPLPGRGGACAGLGGRLADAASHEPPAWQFGGAQGAIAVPPAPGYPLGRAHAPGTGGDRGPEQGHDGGDQAAGGGDPIGATAPRMRRPRSWPRLQSSLARNHNPA